MRVAPPEQSEASSPVQAAISSQSGGQSESIKKEGQDSSDEMDRIRAMVMNGARIRSN
jgi:hypothetical protein